MFNRNTGIVLLVALAAGLGLLLGQKFLGGTPRSPWPPTQTITFYPQPRPLPQFSLRQSDGTQLVPGELNGHWTLVFLGFTFCPDVCPTTLTDLAVAQRQWESVPESLRPRVLFVSVDPQRDRPHAWANMRTPSTRTRWRPRPMNRRWSASPPRWGSCSRKCQARISRRTPTTTAWITRPASPCSIRRAGWLA